MTKKTTKNIMTKSELQTYMNKLIDECLENLKPLSQRGAIETPLAMAVALVQISSFFVSLATEENISKTNKSSDGVRTTQIIRETLHQSEDLVLKINATNELVNETALEIISILLALKEKL